MAKSLRREPVEAPDAAADVRRGIRRLRRVARDVGEPVEELVARFMKVLDRGPEAAACRRSVRRDPDLRDAIARHGEDMVAAALLFDPLRARWMTFIEKTRMVQERMLAERGGVPFPDSVPLIRAAREHTH